jgi:DUF4097 and DUF4098 domain-containing protein YvlB
LGVTGKRSGILFAGVVLVFAGVILLIAPQSAGLAVWLGRVWPLFLVLAGLFRVAGFAIERKPRSPLGGALLVAVGLVLLAGRVDSESNALAIYGKYWMVVLGVYSSAELLRFYSHRHGEGPQPKFFSISKLLVVLLIVSTGILSSRLAAGSMRLFSVIRIPESLASLADSGGIRPYTFEDTSSVTEIEGGSTVTITNSGGDLNVVGGAGALRVVLAKTINAASETDAHSLADRIKLVIEKGAGGVRIRTNRDGVGEDLKTSLRVELPRGVQLAVTSSEGSVSLSHTDGPLWLSAARGPVSIVDISDNVQIILDGSSNLEASNIAGSLSIERGRDAKIANVQGSLEIKASNGSVELHGVRGPINLDVPSCRIKASDLLASAIIKSGHSTIDVLRSSSLSINGAATTIKAEQVNGDLNISSSDGSVRLLAIQGAVAVSASRSSVVIDGLKGEARVQASYAPVAIKNFRGAAFIETSYDRIAIMPGDPVADIQVKNSHGDIRMTLPRSGEFQLNAEAAQGSIRCPGVLGNPILDGTGSSLSVGSLGPRIVLNTVQGDIALEQAGSGQRPE